MFDYRPWMIAAATLALTAIPGLAGPCTTAIDAMQAQVDARIEAQAAAGKTGKEGAGALLHHQPTPGSIASAEEKLGEGGKLQAVLAALARARDADRINDRVACETALAEARSGLAQ